MTDQLGTRLHSADTTAHSTTVVVHFTGQVSDDQLRAVECELDGYDYEVVPFGVSFEPHAGSVVITLAPQLVIERGWLELLIDESARNGTAVGIGVVDQAGVRVHAGAAIDGGSVRPFGSGSTDFVEGDDGGRQLFQTNRRNAQLLPPFAQPVVSAGHGASAMVANTARGVFEGSMVARSVGAEPQHDGSDGTIGSIGSAVPNAVLVIGSTGRVDDDLDIVATLSSMTNSVWLTELSADRANEALAAGCVFLFDPSRWTSDGLASAFEVDCVVHLDESVLADDAHAQQLLRARPGISWVGVDLEDSAHVGRLSEVISVADVGPRVSETISAETGSISIVGEVPQTATVAGLVSVVVPVHGRWDLTNRCLGSLARVSGPRLEIIVVDDASPDETAEMLTGRSDLVVVTNDSNLGFPASVNRGLARTTGEFVCILNNDTEVTNGWLDEMLAVLAIDGTFMVGPRSNNVSGLQRVEGSPSIRDSDAAHEWAETWASVRRGNSWRTNRLVGFCLLSRRSLFVDHGGLDEAFGRGNFEDDELCDRILDAGGSLRVADGSVVLHHGSATFSSLDEDFTATLATAARHRGSELPGHAGSITGIVLSDGDVAATEMTAWSMLGLSDSIRVIERSSADDMRLHLGRGIRLGVEVAAADWHTEQGVESALRDLGSDDGLILIAGAGETLEVTDWGDARAEIESWTPDCGGVRVGLRSEVRLQRLCDGFGSIGSECGDSLSNLRIRQSSDTVITGDQPDQSDGRGAPEVPAAFISAIVLSDGDMDAARLTAVSASEVADSTVVFERGVSDGEPDASEPPTGATVIDVDWTNSEALAGALSAVASSWIVVLEAGERLAVDRVGWMADLCCLPMEPIGLRVGDRVEVRLVPAGLDVVDTIGGEASVVSGGLRVVPGALEHGDIIAARFPELAAASAIRAALAGKQEWAERLSETMVLDEELRMLEQIREERPIDWSRPQDVTEVGVVVAFDPRGSHFGDIEPNAYGRLIDTISSAIDQSHHFTEVVVAVPATTWLPDELADVVRVIEHYGLDEDDPGEVRVAMLANLASTVVSGHWVCIVDVGDRLRFDHVEHLLSVAYEDRSEYVHGLSVKTDGARSEVELAADRQLRTGSLGPVLFYGELRALELRETAWMLPEYAAANRTARWRVLGVQESAAEAVTSARPVSAIHVVDGPEQHVSQTSEGKTELGAAERLHLGCGPNLLADWTNIDLEEQYSPDLVHDLSRGLPFPDGSISLIYSEHFFEHLALDDGLRLLGECKRVLRDGGRLRIAMPDLASLVGSYVGDWRDQVWVEDFPELTSAAHMLNFGLREWGHQYVYDYDDLAARLRGLGFTDVTPKGWGESSHPMLRNRETRPDSLLIAECTA